LKASCTDVVNDCPFGSWTVSVMVALPAAVGLNVKVDACAPVTSVTGTPVTDQS
jgi:hypothetical protein